MYAQIVLIVDSRKEISQKYKKIIQQDSYVKAEISLEIDDAFLKIKELEPDLIILSDNHQENINDLCAQIRKISEDYRPVIVIVSKSSYLDDKLSALRSGADDYLSEPIAPEEFSIRIFAHLRRHVEELSNPVTKFPSYGMTYKVLNRAINSGERWAFLYLDVDNIKPYSEIYGHIAYEKVLKTVAAILKSAVNKGDFVGHLKDDSFIIITYPQKAEMIARFLNQTFDSVASKFYSGTDSKRGYLIINSDEKAGVRIPFVSVSIGIISNLYKTYTSYQEIINSLMGTHKLAKSQPGSSFISDAPQICADNCTFNFKKKKILSVQTDEALGYLLETTLSMQGYEFKSLYNIDKTIENIQKSTPDLIILDAKEDEHKSVIDLCSKIKLNPALRQVKVIISTEIHDKEGVLDSGADLYLPKPYELITLFKWIERFLSYEY